MILKKEHDQPSADQEKEHDQLSTSKTKEKKNFGSQAQKII